MFEFVKRQVLTADIGQVETLYRELQYEQEQAEAAEAQGEAQGEAFNGVQLAGELFAWACGNGTDGRGSVD